MGLFSLANLFGITLRESANDGSDFTNPDADYRRVFLGEDGALHAKDSAGAVTTLGGLADQGTATYLDFTTAAAPSNPAAGKIRVYSKTGDTLAQRTSGGTETVFGAGGGGLTQAYVGKNAIGASWEAGAAGQVTAKKVTLANACLITDVEIHMRYASSTGGRAWLSLWDDNGSGTAPDHLLAYTQVGPHTMVLLDADGAGSDGRWVSAGFGRWVVAGDYWIAWTLPDGNTMEIAYDTSGADRRHGYPTAVTQYGIDWGFSNVDWSADSDTTRDYSIRANTIR